MAEKTIIGEQLARPVQGYSISKSEKSGLNRIMCLTCGRVSHNPNDVANKYCGHCHIFHEDRAQFRAQ